MQAFDIIFYVFAAITILSAFVVVLSRNVIYSAFFLMFTFLGVAGLYVLLQADFLAVAQIMIYVGGILVLLIFGVMLTTKITDVEIATGWFHVIPGTIVAAVLLGTLAVTLVQATWNRHQPAPVVEGTTRSLGESLMGLFILPFETAAVLLLVAVVGAALIARKN